MQQQDGRPDGAALAGSRGVLPPAAGSRPGTAQARGADGGTTRWPARARRGWAPAVLLCYLAGAVAVTWQLWLDPAGRAQVIVPSIGSSPDIGLFAWFMRYAAAAVAHGHLPALVTTAVNAPQGINLMWNTSFLLPGVALSPVTLLAGPLVSLTIMLTLGFAGSAAAMFLVLRRWGAGLGAAALCGAVYGFSPALRMSAVGHYHLQFAVLPPLIIDALLRIITGRGSALRTGSWLGLLMAAQFLTGEELLVLTAVAAAVILAVLAGGQPRAVPARLKASVGGLAMAAGVTLVICGYPLWVQFHGPLASHGNPWRGHFWNRPGDFVRAPGGLLWHSQAAVRAVGLRAMRPEYVAYLGWPVLVLLLVAAVWLWRDPRVRVMALTFAVLETFSLGARTVVLRGVSYPAPLLPWHWLSRLPLFGEVLPNRFSILADGAAAAVLAFAIQAALRKAPEGRRWWRPAVAGVAVLAVAPLIPLPLQAGAVSAAPPGWQAALSGLRLPPMARVLVIPVNPAQTMLWQAQTGEPISIIGGYCIAPGRSGKAKLCPSVRKGMGAYLSSPPAGPLPAGPTARIRTGLRYWRPAAVIAVAGRRTRLWMFLTRLFGRPAVQAGPVAGWRLDTPPRAGGLTGR